LMTLGDRVGGEPMTVEEVDLLRTIADQTAASLLTLKLSEAAVKSREMEAFQTMSAFMVHDLKNVASTLSLTMQNLPVHFDKPEFRDDAFKVISRSVDKIRTMCGSLGVLTQKLDLRRVPMSLSDFVSSALDVMDGCAHGRLVRDLRPMPKALFDPDQMAKVLTNLVLNACEATAGGGEVRVGTGEEGGRAVLEVADTGGGMTKEFMERSLFRPFRTTKKQGMGIGLFHSRMIVEAHGGRIDVQSESGQGTTFKVYLPMK
jgi:putative PEP-CTERM system histidine kinase